MRKRLLVSASLLLVIFLGAMGWALNEAFQQTVLANAEDALRNQVLLLIANLDVDGAQIMAPSILSEPRLSQDDSSLYAQLSTPDRGVLWRSPSLLDKQLGFTESRQGEFIFDEDKIWEGAASVYGLSFGAVWETENGDVPFTIQVAEHRSAYLNRMRQYRSHLVLWLSVLGISLLILLLALLNWGLQPLVKVTRQTGEIEEGNRQRFDQDFPLEVNRLTHNLNQLLNSEQQRIERHRNVLGNLAHSLKTPLAVLRGLQYSERVEEDAHAQLDSMQKIIDYQLQSASAVGRRRFAKPVYIYEPTRKIVSSLEKLFKEREISLDLETEEDVQFYGDQGDWLELVGNLLENAYKWASKEVFLKVHNVELKGNSNSHRQAIRVCVGDDGQGIDDAQKAKILERGVRLDTQAPGHGLGLHIVKGIIEAYEGELSIDENVPNGVIFTAILN